MGQTVNLLPSASVVRIHLPPPVRRKRYVACGEFFVFLQSTSHTWQLLFASALDLLRNRWRLCRLTDAAYPLRVLRSRWLGAPRGGFVRSQKIWIGPATSEGRLPVIRVQALFQRGVNVLGAGCLCAAQQDSCYLYIN